MDDFDDLDLPRPKTLTTIEKFSSVGDIADIDLSQREPRASVNELFAGLDDYTSTKDPIDDELSVGGGGTGSGTGVSGRSNSASDSLFSGSLESGAIANLVGAMAGKGRNQAVSQIDHDSDSEGGADPDPDSVWTVHEDPSTQQQYFHNSQVSGQQ